MESICKTKNLTKKYQNFSALDTVNMNIRKGDIWSDW